jgi:O-antigen/teichoic acid export membrane protein
MSVIVARVLGPQGKGVIALAATVPAVLVGAATLGLGPATGYLAGKKAFPDRELAGAALVWALLLGSGSAAALWLARPMLLAAVLRGFTPLEFALVLIALPASYFTYFATYLMIGTGSAARMSALQTITGIIGFAAIAIALLVLRTGTAGAVAALSLTSVISALAYLLASPKPVLDPRSAWQVTRGAASYAARVTPGQLMFLFFMRADVFFLNALVGTAAVGIYSTGTNIAEKLLILSGSISHAAYSQFTSGERDETAVLAVRVARTTFLITGVVALALAIVAVVAVPLVYGARFSGSAIVAVILLPGVVMFAVGNVYSQYFLGQLGRAGTASGVACALMVLSAIAYPALILAAGMYGAAIASVLIYAGLLALWLFLFPKATGISANMMLLPRHSDVAAYRAVFDRLARAPLHLVRRGRPDSNSGDAK